MARVVVGFSAVLLLAGSACGGSGAVSAVSPTATAGGTAPASPLGPSTLDPEVPMPNGFPADVPVYTGARLTAGASFNSSAQTAWGMEWETLDSVDKVQAFYTSQFNLGDWKISFSGNSKGTFSAVFTRKSNPKVSGLLGAGAAAGVTTITLSLVTAS